MKEKIDFAQFLADLITFQNDFLENNFHRLVAMSDEFKALNEEDKANFLDKARDLIIVDILLSCNQCFADNLSDEKIAEITSIVYGKYLTEYKKISNISAEEKLKKVMELFNFAEKAEEDKLRQEEFYKKIGCYSPHQTGNDIDKQKLYLCMGFSQYCAGEFERSKNYEGKRFAAFKLAQAFAKANIVKSTLKEFEIIWE